jgi:GTPase SAR1 family protein
MDYNGTINIIESTIKDSLLAKATQETLISQLDTVKKRVNDNKLYLGIVGEFSSGKSTLVNSLIGADFFRTNALQGTTTTITKLEYGDRINLQIALKTGETLKYNRDKTAILNKYTPEIYNALSNLKKAWIKVLDVLHINRSDELLLDVFDRITTSNEVSQTLVDATVYYPSKILKNGIVIVDTPGTDSLNPLHSEITRRAIKDICDIALIITTATQAFPQTLANYVEENLGDVADKCIFIITKIELIRKSIERTQIPKVVEQRIYNFLGIDNPNILLAPSLLSLEERGIIEKTELLNHLSDEERRTLCSDFISDIDHLLEKIESEKEATIQDRIRRLILNMRDNLQSEIEMREGELKNELEETHMMRVKPLREFMTDFFSSHVVYQYSYIESVIVNSVSTNRVSFKNYVFNRIDNSSTKDEAQATMESATTKLKGQNCFSNCYAEFKKLLSATHTSYIENFNDFKTSFINTFSIDAVDFTYSILNNPEWQREYTFNYDKTNLTTFPLFRMFKSLDSVKAQMKEDVGPKIDYEFEKMEKHYIACAKKTHVNMEKQMEKVKSIFITKYEAVIAKHIKESDEKEKKLNSQLGLLRNNLDQINQLCL